MDMRNERNETPEPLASSDCTGTLKQAPDGSLRCELCGWTVGATAHKESRGTEARNEWKEAVIDALAAWPGMDFAQDTPPRTIIDAILKMERTAAVELAPAQPKP
jgi:hypothetical protein